MGSAEPWKNRLGVVVPPRLLLLLLLLLLLVMLLLLLLWCLGARGLSPLDWFILILLEFSSCCLFYPRLEGTIQPDSRLVSAWEGSATDQKSAKGMNGC